MLAPGLSLRSSCCTSQTDACAVLSLVRSLHRTAVAPVVRCSRVFLCQVLWVLHVRIVARPSPCQTPSRTQISSSSRRATCNPRLQLVPASPRRPLRSLSAASDRLLHARPPTRSAAAQMHRRPSIAHRPKTSSAAEHSAAQPRPFEPSMKRTASQTFSTNGSDAREAPNALGAVHEGMSEEYHSHHAPSGSRSLSRATSMFEGGFKQIRRKLSSSSSRRPSLTAIFDAPGLSSSSLASSSAAAARKNSSDMLRLPLPHHDSGLPLSQFDTATPPVNSKISMLKRFSSLRRRPAASGPSGEFAKYNPVPPPIPSNYPLLVPGSAARQAAAAANDARLSQTRREQEQTRKFLENGMSQSSIEKIDNDNESGVGMMCSSPIVRADSVLQEKKMGKLLTPRSVSRRGGNARRGSS